jgi:hypothetical protein
MITILSLAGHLSASRGVYVGGWWNEGRKPSRAYSNTHVFFFTPYRAILDHATRGAPSSIKNTAPRYATRIPHDFPAMTSTGTYFDAFRRGPAQSNIAK